MTEFKLPLRTAMRLDATCVEPTKLALVLQVLIAAALTLCALRAPAQEGSQKQAQAQQPNTPQRLSTPRNSASQRYEINQTFGGQAYYKDNNIWVYDQAFAELFGMPARYIEGLEGATAAAFRIEVAPFKQCGFGGRDEACSEVEYCYLDLYVRWT